MSQSLQLQCTVASQHGYRVQVDDGEREAEASSWEQMDKMSPNWKATAQCYSEIQKPLKEDSISCREHLKYFPIIIIVIIEWSHVVESRELASLDSH